MPMGVKTALHTSGPLHPWFHLALFTVLGALAVLSSSRGRVQLLLIAAAILLGLSIEYSEKIRFDLHLEVYDIVTDTCGVALGAVFGTVAGWLLKRSTR